MTSLQLDPDRALPFPAEQRSIAREIYDATKDLPLVCMHGHVEPEVFAEDPPFADPAQLLIVPDHYVFRMLASQGIEPARLGVPRFDGGPVEADSRKIWHTFCENWKLFRGTPSRYWLEHELVEVFGVDQVPSAETADAIYDKIADCVADPAFRPRELLDRFNIEVISTTDSATSDLRHHVKLAADGLSERVFPTFRPDAVAYLDRPSWRADIAELGELTGIDTTSYHGFLDALRSRRAAFVDAGARATDHGHLLADTTPIDAKEAGELYARILSGAEPTEDEADAFAANMLYQMAEMSCEDGLVMQIHPRRSAEPQRRDLEYVWRGQGLRHSHSGRVHPGSSTDAGPVWYRPSVPRHPLHHRRNCLQSRAGSDRRYLPVSPIGRPMVVPGFARGHAAVPRVRR